MKSKRKKKLRKTSQKSKRSILKLRSSSRCRSKKKWWDKSSCQIKKVNLTRRMRCWSNNFKNKSNHLSKINKTLKNKEMIWKRKMKSSNKSLRSFSKMFLQKFKKKFLTKRCKSWSINLRSISSNTLMKNLKHPYVSK